MSEFRYPIVIAKTRKGKDFIVSAKDLQGINTIVGMKFMGKSHLAKTLLLGLVDNGAKCVVFDVNDEYSRLWLNRDGGIREEYVVDLGYIRCSKIFPVRPGVNLRFPLRSIGRENFIDIMESLLEKLGGPSLATLLSILDDMSSEKTWTMNQLEFKIKSVYDKSIKGALERRFNLLKNTGLIVNETEEEKIEESFRFRGKIPDVRVTMKLIQSMSFSFEHIMSEMLKNGGALILNLKGLDRLTMRISVQLILNKLVKLLEGGMEPIFLFAEEAHLYLDEVAWIDVVTRIRHLGAWQFFMTNTPPSIPPLIIRQTDNLFTFHLSIPEDIKHVSPASGMDYNVFGRMVKALSPREFIAVGAVTEQYPLVLRTRELDVMTAGETRLKFRER